MCAKDQRLRKAVELGGGGGGWTMLQVIDSQWLAICTVPGEKPVLRRSCFGFSCSRSRSWRPQAPRGWKCSIDGWADKSARARVKCSFVHSKHSRLTLKQERGKKIELHNVLLTNPSIFRNVCVAPNLTLNVTSNTLVCSHFYYRRTKCFIASVLKTQQWPVLAQPNK